MNGLKNRNVSDGLGVYKRVPRPFDQADIDGEPVETTLGDDLPSLMPTHSAVFSAAIIKRDVDSDRFSSQDRALRYGDVSGSSFGDDLEREHDA